MWCIEAHAQPVFSFYEIWGFSKKKLGEGGGAGPDLVDHPPGCSTVVKLSVFFKLSDK